MLDVRCSSLPLSLNRHALGEVAWLADLAAAMSGDMVGEKLHHHEAGVPKYPRATMIGCSWIDGSTVKHADP